MKALMLYELAPDGLRKVPALYPQHSARLDAFHARGVLLMAGPFGDPPQGAAAVFSSEAAAREFVEGDPFVREGAVSAWHIHPWNEAFSTPVP